MVNSPVRRFLVNSFPRFLAIPALLLVVALTLAGCHPAVTDPKDPKFIVAEKGSWKITRADLDKEVAAFLRQHQTTPDQVGPAKMPIVETVTLKNMVLKKLLLDKAAEHPVPDADKAEAAELEAIKSRIPPGKSIDELLKTAGLTQDDLKKQIHEKLMVENVLKAEAFKNVDPTEQQVNDIYMKNKESFTIPAKTRASRILVHVEQTASAADKAGKKKVIDAAHARVVKGEDFGKVAGDVSEDQSSKSKGGDLGYFQKGENADPEFDDAVSKTKDGTVSPVFKSAMGYEFVKVTGVQPAGLVPIADARNYISGKLKEHNMEEASQKFAKDLLDNSGVTYHLKLVDPPSQMMPPGAGGPGGPGGPEGPGGPGPDASAPPAPPEPPPAPAEAPSAAAPAAPSAPAK